MSGPEDLNRYRKDYRRPYGGKKNIPTVQRYRQEKEDRHSRYGQLDSDDEARLGAPGTQSYVDWAKHYWYGDQEQDSNANGHGGLNEKLSSRHGSRPQDEQRSHEKRQQYNGEKSSRNEQGPAASDEEQEDDDPEGKAPKPDTTEADVGDIKTRRKQMSKRKAARAEREVTDPITHLPVRIHDFTDRELDAVQEEASDDAGAVRRLLHTLKSRTNSGMSQEQEHQQKQHDILQQVFPPPDYELLKEDLGSIYFNAVAMGVGGILGVFAMTGLLWYAISGLFSPDDHAVVAALLKYGLLIGWPLLLGSGIFAGVTHWASKQARDVMEDDVWDNQESMSAQSSKREVPESTLWLNRVLGSLWPLINPDLFDSLADTLEDVMQASLPRLVRMVHIEDMGQGSEAVRILGIKWLPKGAAGKSVTVDGDFDDERDHDRGEEIHRQSKARKDATGKAHNDGDSNKKDTTDTEAKSDGAPGKQDSQRDEVGRRRSDNEEDHGQEEGDAEGVIEGLEAEEGDFVNLEIAFAYKTSKHRRAFRDRARHAHLMLAFYLYGGVKFPVWVELRGVVGTMRVRMQLTPDPPFVALTTVSFLGQPNVDVSCVPLSKRGLNIMDVPLISNFVQSAVDAAVSGYVAPKSITLDLKSMLAGDDFKKDTSARGVVHVRIKRAFDFKVGDASIPLLREGSSDAYVTASWAKFGKPMFSTRVIVKDMEPYWYEDAFCLVGPEEIDAGELLRLQLWDSDRFTADDDLGRIEIPLKHIMRDDETNGRMQDRVDAFQALKAGEAMPGRCEWSVGYFSKTRLLDYQMKEQNIFKDIHDEEVLRDHIYSKAQQKLREASRNEATEIQQLKEEDYDEARTKIISSTRPPEQYPSGILSIQIHQIVGLAVEELSRSRDNDGGEHQGEEEDADSLPSAYATIILNDQKAYRTRVKPKNSKPFFNAGCERFIRDWRTTEVYISVRDARLHETDPLLGLIYLPLAKMFRKGKTSQFTAFFPIVGGIGYGRARISVVFRSVQMQPPPSALGWDYGCARVEASIVGTEGLSSELKDCKLVLRTPIAKKKLYPTSKAPEGTQDAGHCLWKTRHGHAVMLPVRKRYAVALLIEFRSTTRRLIGGAKSPGFAILWLRDLPDDEAQTKELPVYKGDMWRAATNALPHDKRGEQIGTIRLDVTFVRGLSKWHRPLTKNNVDFANVFEVLSVAKDNDIIEGIPGEGVSHKKDYRPKLDEHGVPLEKDEKQNADIHTKKEIEHEQAQKQRDTKTPQNDSDDDDVDSSDDSDDEREMQRQEQQDDSDYNASSRPHTQDSQAQHSNTDGASSAQQSEIRHANEDNANSGKGGISGLLADAKAYKRHEDQLHGKHRGMMQWKPVRTAKWLKDEGKNISHRISGSFELKGKEPKMETEV